MPRVKTTPPREPTREKGQRSLDLPSYIYAVVPQYRAPSWMKASLWRAFVRKQPIAMITKDTLISYVINLDWSVEPKDSQLRDEYKSEIEEYTDFIKFDGNHDYVERTELLLEDLLDTPFGAAMETIREGDDPGGKVLELIPIDADTLYPTRSKDYPVMQRVDENSAQPPIYFPYYAINRVMYAPRPEIMHEGWGMPPPERIYLAMELLSRGDNYYATLLLDTPPPGILDLMDMEEQAAKSWIQSFREFMVGNEVLKIPVLYQHERKAEWISFGKNPNEIAYDSVTSKYASIVTAGYGMTLSDIGFSQRQNGGETLSGTIRQERKTRNTGVARVKRKLKLWYDRILPPYLEFKFVDLDDELSVATGRARLATITAITQAIQSGLLLPNEGRQQLLADGLITIAIPEEMPENELAILPDGSSPERPGMLGKPIAPSQGGFGEVIPKSLFEKQLPSELQLERMLRSVLEPLEIQAKGMVGVIEEDDVLTWYDVYQDVLFDKYSVIGQEDVPENFIVTMQNNLMTMKSSIKHDISVEDFRDHITELLRKYLIARSEYLYAHGKVDEFITDPEVDPELVDEISQALMEIFEESRSLYTKYALNYVVSSVVSAILLDKHEKLQDNKILKETIANMDEVKSRLLSQVSFDFVEKFKELVERKFENA